MFEKELQKFQQEIGEIKKDLLLNACAANIGDEESYKLATKIDLTVNRLLRMMEGK